MRRGKQYRLRWENVSLKMGIITIPRSKHGERRYIPINSAAQVALETLACLLPDRQVGFFLGSYDHRAPLVIDPLVVYATGFGVQGGGGDEEASGVKVDAAGYAYVVGTTNSGISHKAIFVDRYDPTGARPLYTTLLSGGCDSLGGDIAIDRAGSSESRPDSGWIRTVSMPSASATRQACWPPAPPKQLSR